jgi:hypothetical protein
MLAINVLVVVAGIVMLVSGVVVYAAMAVNPGNVCLHCAGRLAPGNPHTTRCTHCGYCPTDGTVEEYEALIEETEDRLRRDGR